MDDREGIAQALYWDVPMPQIRDWDTETDAMRELYLKKADAVIKYLESVGVLNEEYQV